MADLDAFEAAGSLDYTCAFCKDWGSVSTGPDVEALTHYPCPRCRRETYEAWAASQPPWAPELGGWVLERSTGRVGEVVLPSAVGFEGDSYIQPTQGGSDPCSAAVLLREDPSADVWWVRLCDAERAKAPERRG